MKAYVTKIDIENDEGCVIGSIEHEVDEVYHFVPKENTYILADDYRFIAKILEKESLYIDIKVS